ncbi:uncharacterized protein IUM83_04745 [Phytophthora cinnamomi]|uniref:uncharacterized protein n=1 Tax=Phytophthora cinnamomi TaxID=4785 RepID=UPI0035598AB6|nr:hypothetical protein IUM83_04745 [Phytophthora cinnamomi]
MVRIRSSKREKTSAVAAVVRDLDFPFLWRQLRAVGWTYKKPRGLSTEGRYVKPDGSEVFAGEHALVAYALESDLMEGIIASAGQAASAASAQTTGTVTADTVTVTADTVTTDMSTGTSADTGTADRSTGMGTAAGTGAASPANQLLQMKPHDFVGVVATPTVGSQKRKRASARHMHASEQIEDWVTVSGVQKRRQRV